MSELQRLMSRWAQVPPSPPPPGLPPAPPAAPPTAPPAAPPAAVPPIVGEDLDKLPKLGGLQGLMAMPFQQVDQLRQVGQAEQLRDIATSGAGMADATRENLVQYFTQMGLGITPEVDKTIADLSTSITVDWSDPMTVDTIFGTYDPQQSQYRSDGVLSKALQNGGPPLAASVMQSLKQFYDMAMPNPTFNRGEMLEIMHHWLKGDMDPAVLAVKTRGFLDSATRDWSDPMAAMGITDPAAAEKGRKMRQLFQGILGMISERPDQSQRSTAMGEREFQRWRQQSYRAWEAMARRMGVPVYKAMEMTSQWAGNAANYLGDFGNPAVNAAFALAQPALMAGTASHLAYLPFGQQGQTLTGYQPLQAVPMVSERPTITPQQAAPRAASEERSGRFVRLAQAVWNPSMSGGEIVPQGGHQGQSAQLDAMQQDMMRMMGNENLMAADAAQLSYNQLLGNEWFMRTQALQHDVNRIQQDLTAYDEDIRTGRGAADLRLIDSVNQMSSQLAQKYGELLGLFDEGLRQQSVQMQSYQQALQYSGPDPGLEAKVKLADMAMKGIAAKRKEFAIQRNTWLLKSRKMGEDLRVQARDVMSVQPLRTMRDVLREGYGADAGASLALASEEMAQARSRMQQYQQLRGLDPNVGGVQAGHALNQAYQQYLSAIKDIDRSAQPALQQGQQAEILGV